MDGYGGPGGYNELLEEVVQGRQPAPEDFSQVLFERTGRAKMFKHRPARPEDFCSPSEAIKEVAALAGVSVTFLLQFEKCSLTITASYKEQKWTWHYISPCVTSVGFLRSAPS